MKTKLLILLTLIHGMVFSQTHLIFHKSHSGSMKSFKFLMNHGLLDNNSSGEGLASDEDRIIKLDSVKVIGENQVVIFSQSYKIQIVDTNYMEGVKMNTSVKQIKKTMKSNYGSSITENTKILKSESKFARLIDEKMIPTHLGGRVISFDEELLSEDSIRTISLTNTTDIPIDFNVYLNSKVVNYHIRLIPNESKTINIKLFQGIKNELIFYLLSDDQTNTKMIFGSLKVRDLKTNFFVYSEFNLAYCSSVQLSINNSIKGSSFPIYTQPLNKQGNKGLWLVGLLLVSLLITGISLLRARIKISY